MTTQFWFLKEGHYYKNGKGETIGPLKYRRGIYSQFPFYYHNLNYTREGFNSSNVEELDLVEEVTTYKSNKPRTETVSPGVDQIPFCALEALGAIFAEGQIIYGKDNWKADPSNTSYNEERLRHAIRHLFLHAEGDVSESHLAKVMWYCATTIWRNQNADKT